MNMTKWKLYARRIQERQHDLGLPISSFDNIGMSAKASYGNLYERKIIMKVIKRNRNYQMKSNTKVTLIMNKRDIH